MASQNYAPRLMEYDIKLVRDYIVQNIPTSLALVRTDRADAKVSTENPQSYFIYPRAHGYKLPAVFVIGESMSMSNSKGQNSITADSKVNVAIVVEDKNRENLTIKCYRYQAALHDVLHLTQLTDAANRVRIFIRVSEVAFSPLYSTSENEEDPSATFRKEVSLSLDIEHIEAMGVET